MAKQIVTILTDDLDGGEADRTVEFGLDGVSYTIDLSDKNAGALRKALDPFISAAARLPRTSGVTRRGASRGDVAAARTGRAENQEIRAWAKANGRQLADRGRIPTAIVDEYRAS